MIDLRLQGVVGDSRRLQSAGARWITQSSILACVDERPPRSMSRFIYLLIGLCQASLAAVFGPYAAVIATASEVSFPI